MAFKFVFLLALFALTSGLPAIETVEDSGLNLRADNVEEVEQYLRAFIHGGIEAGQGSMIVQNGSKQPRSSIPSHCILSASIVVNGVTYRFWRC